MTTTRTENLNGVTRFLPIQSHTHAIAGEFANVKLLLAKGAGPHDFQCRQPIRRASPIPVFGD